MNDSFRVLFEAELNRQRSENVSERVEKRFFISYKFVTVNLAIQKYRMIATIIWIELFPVASLQY